MSQRDVEVAIVGGGVAGLAAAHECLALGKEFLVFEAGVRPGGMLHYEVVQGGKQIVFYCAYGERSVLAVRTAQEAGLDNVCHVIGGLGAWIAEGGMLDR